MKRAGLQPAGGGGTGGTGGEGGSGGTAMQQPGLPPAVLEGCPVAENWDVACLSGEYLGALQAIDPLSGATCALPVQVGEWLSTSFAVLDDDVFHCNYQRVFRLSLVNGESEDTAIPCDAVVAWNGLLVRHEGQLTHYAGFPLDDGTPLVAMMDGALLVGRRRRASTAPPCSPRPSTR